jgi:predicted RNA-binding Zn-ribbon protein involved in translation (DUF1610 family)
MDELVYFSRRKIAEDKGPVIAWARKMKCPKCKKGLMAKPVDPKTKKVQIRAKEYRCPNCGYTEEKKEHEAKLSAEIIYECPFCGNKGEVTAPFARKSWYGKKAVVFQCAKCKEKLGLTKKLATPPDFIAKVHGKPVKARADEGADVEGDEDDDF